MQQRMREEPSQMSSNDCLNVQPGHNETSSSQQNEEHELQVTFTNAGIQFEDAENELSRPKDEEKWEVATSKPTSSHNIPHSRDH